MNEKTIIFDFDGTIADSMMAVSKVVNRLADKYGYRKITKEGIEAMKNKKIQEILKIFGIPLIKLPFFLWQYRREFEKEIPKLKPFAGIRAVLTKLHKSGFKLGMLTSNDKENVAAFVKKNDLGLFEIIYANISIFGKGRALIKLLKENNLNSGEAVYIGDEVRDIEAARKAGIKVIAVTWGFQGKQILEKYHPDYLVDKPSEILNIINKFT